MHVGGGWRACLFVLCLSVIVVGCGKKGPPLAPLRLVPEAPPNVTSKRLGNDVHLQFVVPAKNATATPGVVDIDHVEIYALSLPPGVPAPPNREFLTPKYVVATLPVKPAPVPGQPAPEPLPADTRPAPGETASFVEKLTPEMLNPPPPKTPPPPAVIYVPGQVPAVPVIVNWWLPKAPLRIYAIRAVTTRHVSGNPSPRQTVPLVSPPPPPTSVTVTNTEKSVVISWTLPEREGGGALRANVYSAKTPSGPPLNPAPIAETAFERPGVTFGVEECFTVRTVEAVAGVTIESEPYTPPACITPQDTFPPAAPVGLDAVPNAGVIALIWDANTDADLAGYLVLRADAPGETLRPITAQPIRETVFRDTTVKPGVRYTYAIVAVDTATPPNTSRPSIPTEVTAIR